MNTVVKFLFGHHWYILLYVLFYLLIIFPVAWSFSEVKFILTSGGFTGPGYGTWAFLSGFFACWALFVLTVLIYVLLYRLHLLTILNFLALGIVFIVLSYFIVMSDVIWGFPPASFISGLMSFFTLISASVVAIVTNFYILWRLQQSSALLLGNLTGTKILTQVAFVFLGSAAISIITVFILYSIWIPVEKQNQNLSTNSQDNNQINTSNVNMLKTEKINFPTTNYKEFASSDNVDSLDPKTATPNITEYGTPHLTIIQKNDGYATVAANLLAAKINVPLGWESMGGFDPLDKIFFYPKGARPSSGGLPLPFIALKILDSSGLGVSDFNSVMQKIDDFMKESEANNPAYKNRVSYIDLPNKTFAFEVRGVKHAVTGKPLGTLDIYIQDPNPGSTLWADLQLSVPDEQYEKYKSLDGLMYKDLEINWIDLAKIMSQSR